MTTGARRGEPSAGEHRRGDGDRGRSGAPPVTPGSSYPSGPYTLFAEGGGGPGRGGGSSLGSASPAAPELEPSLASMTTTSGWAHPDSTATKKTSYAVSLSTSSPSLSSSSCSLASSDV